MSELTIPVQVDSIKSLAEFQRTRCIYVRIEIEGSPVAGPYSISHEDRALLAVSGNWAVLAGPGPLLDADGFFGSPESIELTVLSIEADEELFMDLGYIWLPNDLLGLQDRVKDVRRGDVYRLSTPFFRQCYRFVTGAIAEDVWLEFCRLHSEEIRPSPRETVAFRAWRRQQIQRSRDRYHHSDYADRRLPKKESAG